MLNSIIMERHKQAVGDIAESVRRFFKEKKQYRIFHGSSNSTRPRPECNFVDISILSNILVVDAESRTVLLEPNVAMDKLVEATLQYGLYHLW